MSNCDKLLENGLYSFTRMTNTGSFSQDLRTYYLSEQFKSDMKSGKWGNSVTIPIEGVPVTLDMDFSEEKYSEFKSKLLQVTQLSISSNFYETFYSSIPNTNLYDAYVECVRIKEDVSKKGFIQGLNVETEDTVVFTIHYRPQAPGDSMPIVQTFNVQPEGSVVNGGLTVGQSVDFDITVTCKRHEDKDLVLSLDTDRGSIVSKSIAEGSFSTNKDLPIGTIITSFLNFEQFNLATKNNEKSPGGIWTSQKSRWSPCDGRPIPNSKFGKITSQTNIPDLRGVFTRGLNSFDPFYTIPPQNATQLNPEAKTVGVYQPDEFASHRHGVNYNDGNYAYPATGTGLQNNSGQEFRYDRPLQISIKEEGGQETRPKNVSVYYYIKIN